jgi:hypothetical protein
MTMLDAKTVLDVLENDFQSIESQLGPQWAEFSHRGGDLADRFSAISGNEDPQAAVRALESAVNKLLIICWDYAYVAELLDRAEETPLATTPMIAGNRRPPSPENGPKFNPKEIANRYYSLLVKLKETSDQNKWDANDR